MYFGLVVGEGVVAPKRAKVKSITDCPILENKKKLMGFLRVQDITENFVYISQKSLFH